MEKQTRVEKYKKLREEINDMDTFKFDNPYQLKQKEEDENDVAMSDTTLQEEHVKKNTLSISIDQIVKAHEEYTTMIAQEDLKKAKKSNDKEKRKKYIFWGAIGLGIAVIITLVVVLIVVLSNKGK